jgi:hypothetical protein
MEKPPGHAAFVGALREDQGGLSTDDLFAAAKNVQGLTEHPGWKVIRELLDARAQRLLTQLIHGPVLDQAKYASATGMVSGLEQSRYVVESVLFEAQRVERELAERHREEAS